MSHTQSSFFRYVEYIWTSRRGWVIIIIIFLHSPHGGEVTIIYCSYYQRSNIKLLAEASNILTVDGFRYAIFQLPYRRLVLSARKKKLGGGEKVGVAGGQYRIVTGYNISVNK